MLFEKFFTDCIFQTKQKVSDGEGGFIETWVDGEAFKGSIVFNNSTEAKLAEKQGVKDLYTVTTPIDIKLEYHQVFKRLSDNKIFRVTTNGNDAITPTPSSFKFSQVSAEEWRLN